eukprot:TRINITY_DN4629_c0_g1_i1.p1 TRINITY_DN4629_c0_g1~~TRINITY_DN4629_c0_g1_i1.p1  ORF type:complete len:254 (+),score=44.92 TRINITY_DN4629_c0_g1_i1:236-997(+)
MQKIIVALVLLAWAASSLVEHRPAQAGCILVLVLLPLQHTHYLGAGLWGRDTLRVTWWKPLCALALLSLPGWYIASTAVLHLGVVLYAAFLCDIEPTVVSAVVTGPPGGSMEKWLTDFYLEHNPAKATQEHVRKTLTRYAGKEELLVARLRERYSDPQNGVLQQESALPEADASSAPPPGADALLAEVHEQLEESGEARLESASVGECIEVYFSSSHTFVIQACGNKVSLPDVEHVLSYLAAVPQIETFAIAM